MVRDTVICKIAELIVEIPTAGGMALRCSDYIINNKNSTDIIIASEKYNTERWSKLSREDAIYLESGGQFYSEILFFEGMMLHSSGIELDGKAYLFSGPCGVGKSTHSKLWQNVFGNKAQVFNDDKPALRQINHKWFAYGTPWCGKDGINQNKKVQLAGICFLKRGSENSIRKLDKNEAIVKLLSQTFHRFNEREKIDLLLQNIERLIDQIPIYELTNNAQEESALLSYETMRKGAEEAGL